MSKYKLSVSIMHCSWNKDRVNLLKLIEKKIDKSLLCGFSISDDLNKEGIWANYKNALMQAHDEATHHIVLQDDMLPCDNFIPTLLKLINKIPDNPIHFFASTKHYADMLKEGNNLFTATGGIWGGSTVLPKKYFYWHKWFDYYFSNDILGKNEDDTRMGTYFEFNNVKVYCVTPGLMEHLGENSLIGNPSGRSSKTFTPDGFSINLDNDLRNVPDVGFIWGYTLMEIKKALISSKKEEFFKKYAGGNLKSLIKSIKRTRVKR